MGSLFSPPVLNNRIMKTLKADIEGKAYLFGINLKTILTYESITNKVFQGKSTIDFLAFMYSALIANNDFSMEFDKFIDFMDAHPDLMFQMTNLIFEYYKEKNESRNTSECH